MPTVGTHTYNKRNDDDGGGGDVGVGVGVGDKSEQVVIHLERGSPCNTYVFLSAYIQQPLPPQTSLTHNHLITT